MRFRACTTAVVAGAIALLATGSAAAAVPSASTGGARSVTQSSAVLAGTVNPNSAPTTYVFQYGTTRGYGAATPTQGPTAAVKRSLAVSAGVAGLAPLADPGTAAARVDLTFRERAFWLFFQGHRLGDLRRLIRQYGRSQDTVFPIGPYKNNGSFGTDVNVAVPSGEDNNPNFHGCLDRNP